MKFNELVDMHKTTHRKLNNGLLKLLIQNRTEVNYRQIKRLRLEIKEIEEKIVRLVNSNIEDDEE